MLANILVDDAPGEQEVAMDGVTGRLMAWMVASIDASRRWSLDSHCAWSRVVPPLQSSCFRRARSGRSGLPGAKLSLPIVNDVWVPENCLCGDVYGES